MYDTPIASLISRSYSFDEMIVSDCLTADKQWNVEFLNDLLPPDFADILGIFIPSSDRRDKLVWGLNPDGLYSVKSRVMLL